MRLLNTFRGPVQDKPKDEDLRIAIKRRSAHKDKILKMFADGEAVTTTSLRAFSANHTARISQLRSEGHVIVRSYLGQGVFDYTYLGKNDEE